MLFPEHVYKYMYAALQEAEQAYELKEVPIGAVVIYKDRIIGKGFNQTEMLHDPTAHAEMLAITAAANHLNSKILDECDLYVTAEPCIMCSGAILLARIRNLYFSVYEPKFGAAGSLLNLVEKNKYNHKINVYSGIYADESKTMLSNFFKNVRVIKSEDNPVEKK